MIIGPTRTWCFSRWGPTKRGSKVTWVGTTHMQHASPSQSKGEEDQLHRPSTTCCFTRFPPCSRPHKILA
ncbi:hypothetical protein RHMOL_Rhmol11G0122800 [Rhododendron molle]|uniref:Uncharacterized protein n=1 Tax=Rhododendron molle TaxID=49168 RepID=A0ACC0LSD5_RHOML|nr:hypothetical protein RHMOL_Rhmol11G0122800 [Rhododendron molle]